MGTLTIAGLLMYQLPRYSIELRGRKGPYFHNGIGRLMDSRGANQVVCPRKPQAFERLERFLSNSREQSDVLSKSLAFNDS